MTNSNSNLKKTLEQREQRSKHLDGVIVQLEEELRQKQAEVAEMEAEYPPDDGESDCATSFSDEKECLEAEIAEKIDRLKEIGGLSDSSEDYEPYKMMNREFEAFFNALDAALDTVHDASEFSITHLEEHRNDDFYVPVDKSAFNGFMEEIKEKADAIEAELCKFNDMLTDAQNVIMYGNTYPVKKYRDRY